MKNRVEMVLDVPTNEAKNIIAALEKENAHETRFSSNIFLKAGKLVVKIESNDIIALRATLNSYLRYLQTIETIDKNKGDLE